MPLHCYNRRMSQPLFQLTGYRDDFGAIYIGGRGLPRESVLEWTRAGLEKIFTRVILDPARGLVMLMTPSQPHEDAEAGVEAVIEEGTNLLNQDVEPLRKFRWRLPGSDPATGSEADCSFYIGAKAIAYAKACLQEQGAEYADNHPPDLVVEIGVTHFDHDKRAVYRDLGVAEYWQARVGKRRGDIELEFLALGSATPDLPLVASRVLPGLTPEAVAAAVSARATARPRPADRRIAIGKALHKHGFPRPVAEERNDQTKPPELQP